MASRWVGVAVLAAVAVSGYVGAAGQTKSSLCRTEEIDGEISKGQPFVHGMGGNLELVLQPIHSGWIVRVLPLRADLRAIWRPEFRDYAMLATPPYQSVSPLSVSTDFGFRAQDAAGWNPRRFRFATSPEAFARLEAAYLAFGDGRGASGPAQSALAAEVAKASDGVLTLLEVKLAAGTADQSSMAAAVSFRFQDTAHTLVQRGPAEATALGELLSIRFSVRLELPAGFVAERGAKILPHVCGSR